MKLLQKLLEQLVSPLSLGLFISIGVSVYVSLYYRAPQDYETISKANQFVYDQRLKARGVLPGHPDIAILAIDDRSLLQEGRWPWPRQKMAELVRRTMESGARLVAFDMVFSEDDPNSSRSTLADVQRKLQKKGLQNGDINEVLQEQMANADSDAIFGNTIKNYSSKLVLGNIYERPQNYERQSPTSELCYNIIVRGTPADEYWRHNEDILILTPNELKIPDSLIDHYQQYFFDVLEQDAIKGWLKLYPTAAEQIEGLVNLIGEPLNKDLIPVLLTYWVHGNLAKVALPEPANTTLVEGLRDIFNLSRSASIHAATDLVDHKYCDRFLTASDDLLSAEAYKANNESEEGFANYDLHRVWPEIQQKAPQLAAVSLDEFVKKVRSEARHSTLVPTDDWRVNIAKIAAGKKHSGFFNTDTDNDGVIRTSSLFARYGELYVPSLPLKSIAVLSNTIPAVDWKVSNKKYLDSIENKTLTRLTYAPGKMWLRDEDENVILNLPVNANGSMLINYSGPSRTFPHISAADILSEEDTIEVRSYDPVKNGIQPSRPLKSEYLKNKILFLGPTAMAVFDMRVTPFEENYPGVETHANALSNLLIEYQRAKGIAPAGSEKVPGFLHRASTESLVMPIVLLFLGSAVAFAISYFGSIAGLLITIVTLAAILTIDRFVFFNRGIVISVLFPLFLTVLLYVFLTFHKYFTEERKKRELKGVFEKYVSPSIVAEVLSHPENLELGGRKQALTVMFSDVRGFTTISEKLDPRELSSLLNSYLTPMTQLVFKNKGTLDKYMGDAIMAFFGAPVKFADHPKWAARCALEMLDKLKELQAKFKSQNLPEIDIGIGLNTGDVSVGNMGSDTVQSYTVMGDAVNLASRLEGINKEYGTRIVISEFTQKALGPEFITRELDWVRVKGKAQPVVIFELVCEVKEGSELPEHTRLGLRSFAEGIGFYHQQKWQEAISSFRTALTHLPNDPPSELYIERCEEYQINPPPAGWDGVFTMTTK